MASPNQDIEPQLPIQLLMTVTELRDQIVGASPPYFLLHPSIIIIPTPQTTPMDNITAYLTETIGFEKFSVCAVKEPPRTGHLDPSEPCAAVAFILAGRKTIFHTATRGDAYAALRQLVEISAGAVRTVCRQRAEHAARVRGL